ncbi:MAG TPA: hypothetical protein VK896_10030, partial [Gaiellaceae bacterium]|nr:hypothetical protein [Gaiellaceae bacterium]
TDPLPAADVAFANIELAAVEALDARIDARTFVASGSLERDRLSLARWRHVGRRTLGGWAADRFERT